LNSSNQNQNLDPNKPLWLFTDCFDFEVERHEAIIEKGYELVTAFMAPVPQPVTSAANLLMKDKQQMQVATRLFFKRPVSVTEWNELKAQRTKEQK